uniref:Uroporphyrinogen decarboxylase (URO-D) domain-containing protein n=1 Tax=Candidatus Caldatribacterium saccharofermentans TaxID=1454753 RepID=A0A7V4TIF7_9BACT
MNTRERFLEVMHGNSRVCPPKWEFGYWGGTVERWYREGLPKRHYPCLPQYTVSPTSHLYVPCWKSIGGEGLPPGIAVVGGGLYWPTQGFPLDMDVRMHFDMDKPQILLNVNLLFYPPFEVEIIEEDEERLIYRDLDGVKRLFSKETAVLPSALEYPIRDWSSWQSLKAERLRKEDVVRRLPPDWDELVVLYKERDFPLVIGGYPHGLFGTLATLMGYENLFVGYYDSPELIRDIIGTFVDLWISVYEEVLARVEIDALHIWEDMSFGKGPMISPAIIKEFMVPYYRRLTDFMKARGVDIILLDTDGYCFDIIPLLIEGGITGIYPIEVSCGMDLVKVRKTFPELKLLGGIPKSEIAQGKERIDQILEPVAEVLRTGGYIPFGDHLIPPEVSFEAFSYYRRKLNWLIDEAGRY